MIVNATLGYLSLSRFSNFHISILPIPAKQNGALISEKNVQREIEMRNFNRNFSTFHEYFGYFLILEMYNWMENKGK